MAINQTLQTDKMYQAQSLIPRPFQHSVTCSTEKIFCLCAGWA